MFPRKYVAFLPLFLVGGVALFCLGIWGIMWLWNWLTPALWGWPTITFWQAVGLLVLCRVLFGRLGMAHGRNSGGWSWRQRMRDRYHGMTPEEKERFKKKIMDRWGIDDSTPGSVS
jgi:hypothetical protein